jgi:predicted transcriptional regulator
MNIQAEKLSLIEWISQLNDNSIVDQLKEIKGNFDEKQSQAESDSVNRGLKDFKEGRVYSDETARKIYEKYL